jgi:hypothetical protein
MALDHSCQVKRHPYAERRLDLYETPPPATEALLRVEQLPRRIWEPAAGKSAIVRVLRDHGHTVVASDIFDYGKLDFVADFLKQERMPPGCGCILTNPPYRFADAFVAHALNLAPLVIMLVRLAFLESKRRSHILDNAGLGRIHVFQNRLPMMHRDGWSGPKASSAIAFCWLVWERGYTGPIIFDRIRWTAEPEHTAPESTHAPFMNAVARALDDGGDA